MPGNPIGYVPAGPASYVVLNAPVKVNDTFTLGGLTTGTTYYIKSVYPKDAQGNIGFTLSATIGGPMITNLTPSSAGGGTQILSIFPSSTGLPTTASDCVNRITRVLSDYDSTDSWSPIDSLVFTSTMPIQPEIASSTNFLVGNSAYTGGSTNSIIPAFTDISLPLDGGATDYLGKITYAPAAQYRWLEFVTNQSLTGFNFQLLWRNRITDQLARVFLKPNGSVQMKFMLQRKF
jgi:hypothetical protein